MPSSKRSRGRQRRAAAVPSLSRLEKKQKECLHGCIEPPPEGHPIFAVWNTFMNIPGRNGLDAMEEVTRKFPVIINDNEIQSMMKGLMIATGTNILIKEERWEVATHLAKCVAFLEDFERCGPTKKILKDYRDLGAGGERDVVCFFGKRIPCDCLADKFKEAKQKKKMGNCFHCQKKFEFQALKKCSRCSLAHYCSAWCQNADWSEHKEMCKRVSK